VRWQAGAMALLLLGVALCGLAGPVLIRELVEHVAAGGTVGLGLAVALALCAASVLEAILFQNYVYWAVTGVLWLVLEPDRLTRPAAAAIRRSEDNMAIASVTLWEIAQRAALAVVIASVFILLYISFAFRQVARPFRYGACAILAMIHDVLVVLGLFSIMGKVFGTEVDSMFITAVLTVIGFSVHDTIVVFDRTRENLRRLPGREFGDVVNVSLNQTVARSLTTSLTVILTLVALLLFGGVTIRNFVLTLLIGIISGTYSSIFIASQLLVMWEYGELSASRWFGGRGVSARPEAAVGGR